MINYFLLITTKENYIIDKDSGFKLIGLPFARRKTAELMKPGDKIVYYIKGMAVVPAIAEVTSLFYRDTTKIWADNILGEVFPWRVSTKPFIINEGCKAYVNFRDFVEKLDLIKNPSKWGTYLESSIRKISNLDYLILESALKQSISILNQEV